MSFKINTIKCPQCGGTKHTKTQPNHYVCQSCQTEFVIVSSNAPKKHVVTHTVDQKVWDLLGNIKSKALWFVVAGIGLVWLLMSVLGLLFGSSPSKSTASRPQVASYSRIEATTVYQGAEGPALLITAAEADGRDGDAAREYIMTMAPLTSANDKGQQQRLTVAQPRTSQPVKFKRLPNGELYLVLLEAEAYRFNPVSREFDAMNQAIQQAHPEALSAGISKLTTCYDGLDGACLEVMSNNGVKYVYYPMLDKLLLESDKYDAGTANVAALAKRQAWVPHYFFKEINSSSKRKQAGKYLLKGMRPEQDGGPYGLGYVSIYDPNTDGFWIGGAKELLRLSTGYAVFSRWGNGYASLVELTPGKLYFNEAVLAENDDQVLLRFDATPSEANRFLQALDKASGEVVWSRPITDFPNIDRNGTYVTAEGLHNGFLLIANVNKPAVLVDGQGQVVKQFVQ